MTPGFFLEPWGLEWKLTIPPTPWLLGSRVIQVDSNIAVRELVRGSSLEETWNHNCGCCWLVSGVVSCQWDFIPCKSRLCWTRLSLCSVSCTVSINSQGLDENEEAHRNTISDQKLPHGFKDVSQEYFASVLKTLKFESWWWLCGLITSPRMAFMEPPKSGASSWELPHSQQTRKHDLWLIRPLHN